MNRQKFRNKKQFNTNSSLVKLGTFLHKCGNLSVLKLETNGIPFPNAFIFDKNKKQVGKIEEVFGLQNDAHVAIECEKAEEYFIYDNKLIPVNRFLERTETEKRKEANDKTRQMKTTKMQKGSEIKKDKFRNNKFKRSERSDKRFKHRK